MDPIGWSQCELIQEYVQNVGFKPNSLLYNLLPVLTHESQKFHRVQGLVSMVPVN